MLNRRRDCFSPSLLRVYTCVHHLSSVRRRRGPERERIWEQGRQGGQRRNCEHGRRRECSRSRRSQEVARPQSIRLAKGMIEAHFRIPRATTLPFGALGVALGPGSRLTATAL